MHYKGLKKKKNTYRKGTLNMTTTRIYIFTKNQKTNYFLNPGIMISEWQYIH